MYNRSKSDDWIEALDIAARIAVFIIIIGSSGAFVLALVMLFYKVILV